MYSSGGRGERREPAGPGYPPAHVPPPPQYRPSWPSRGMPEAEPSWPSPGSQEPGDDRWSGPGRPDGAEYGRPGAGRGQADPRRSGAGAGTSGRGTVSVSGSSGARGANGGPAGKDDRLPSKLWMSILGGVVVVALVAVGVTGTLFMISDHGSGSASAHAGQAKHDISSQQVDPKPLSTSEVFPAATITPNPAGPGYQVVKSEETKNCGTGAVGDLATLMTSQGCTQLVRATVVSPDNAYVITTGIFNLRDKTGAQAADSAIEASVGTKKGRFPGFAAGGATDVIAQAPTQLGWDYEGHFLVYCVVARGDGKPIDPGDQSATKIINDLVEVDLKGTVIADRITPPPSPSGSVAPSKK